MPWLDDEYLVDHRERTLTPLTDELRDEMGRIRSSTRYAIRAVGGEFERLVREGYRVVRGAGERLFRNPSGEIDYQNMGSVMFRAGEGELAKQMVALLKRAGYRAVYQGPGKATRSQHGYGMVKGTPVVWSDAPKAMMEAASLLVTPSSKYNNTEQSARLTYPAEYAVLAPLLGMGKQSNPEYNVFTKAQFAALKTLNRNYPKGDVYLGEIKLRRGEGFSDALAALERLNRETGISHDVVQYQGKYYSAPDAWVERVLVDTRMESRAARESARQSSPRSASKPGGGGGIRGAVKAGWRELMS